MSRRISDATRTKIQNVTIRFLSQKGYLNISMDEIAGEAGITKRTLYHYYPSKIALFVSILENYLQDFVRDERQVSYAGLSFQEALVTMFSHLHEFTKKRIVFMRLFWLYNSDIIEGEMPRELAQSIEQFNDAIKELAVKNLGNRPRTGFFNKYPPHLIVQMFSALNKGISLQSEKPYNKKADKKPEQALFNLFRDMIVHCAQSGDDNPAP
jgi:AcrR family transcriptional regulator